MSTTTTEPQEATTMTQEEVQRMILSAKTPVRISLGVLLSILATIVGSVAAGTAVVVFWLASINNGITSLSARVDKLEASQVTVSPTVSPTGEGGQATNEANPTINIHPNDKQRDIDELKTEKYPQLNTGQLALLEDVTPRTILRRIDPERSVYVDARGQEWAATRVGLRWYIENPYATSDKVGQ